MAGYSGTPLCKKLGLKAGLRVLVVNEPKAYWDWISPLPEGIVVSKAGKETDFIHLFVKSQKEFEKEFVRLKSNLTRSGLFWVSWPKKSSGVVSDLDENKIRAFGLSLGLVDVKVCAVDETWSALKFVYRVGDR